MKKLIKILGLLFLCMTILFSCSEDSKSDKESNKDKKKDKYKKEIKDPCDILDYTIEIFENLERLSDKYDDIDDLEDDRKDKKRVNGYFDDLEDAWKYSFKKFDVDEMMGLFGNCNNTWQMEDLLYEVEYFFQERSADFTDFIDMKMYDLETEYHEREAAATDYSYTEEATESNEDAAAASGSEDEVSAANVVEKTVGWPDALINVCVDEMLGDFDNDAEMAAMSEMLEMPSNQEIAECACEAMSNAFPNLKSLDEMEMANEDEIGMLMADCFGDGFKKLMNAIE